jgi:hypothetical protein
VRLIREDGSARREKGSEKSHARAELSFRIRRIFATIPISPQVTPRGPEMGVDGAKAVTYGHYRGVHRRVYRRHYATPDVPTGAPTTGVLPPTTTVLPPTTTVLPPTTTVLPPTTTVLPPTTTVLPPTTTVLPPTMGGGTGTIEVAQRRLRRHRQREVADAPLPTPSAGGRVCQELAAGVSKHEEPS